MSAIEHLRQQIRKRIELSASANIGQTESKQSGNQDSIPDSTSKQQNTDEAIFLHETNTQPVEIEPEKGKKDQHVKSRRASLSMEWKDIVQSATQKLKTKEEELNRQLAAAQEEATLWQDKVDTIETDFTERSLEETDPIISFGVDFQELNEKLLVCKHKKNEWKQKYVEQFNTNQDLLQQLEKIRLSVVEKDSTIKELAGCMNETKNRLLLTQPTMSTTELCRQLMNEVTHNAEQIASCKTQLLEGHSETLEKERLQSELADWKSRFQSLDSLFLSAQQQLKQDCEQWRQKYKECSSKLALLEENMSQTNKLQTELDHLDIVRTQEREQFTQQLETMNQNIHFLKHSLKALREASKRSWQSLLLEAETDLRQLLLKVKANNMEPAKQQDVKILKEKVRILSEENKIMAVHIEILNKTIEAATRTSKSDTKLALSQPAKRPEHKTILRSRTLT